ncbi:helix-turn-helix domain-containing protein [Amycolatopsis acidiphila]|nr:helix-turn-helix domain-containing protein [Amycolatopsis acidiphila]UIJ64189.1 helix-turn-helix domain-containing protein [Amycolatopsis acidiphila]
MGRPREHDVAIARLSREGKSIREIADALAITPRTVARARARWREQGDAA